MPAREPQDELRPARLTEDEPRPARLPDRIGAALTNFRFDMAKAWGLRDVRWGLVATVLLFLGSLTPAYLPQASPWWIPLRAIGADNDVTKVIGTIMVLAAVALLVRSWFRLRHHVYRDVKHWAILLIWILPMLIAPPIFSHDAYAYAAQGWLWHNGVNPYSHGPGVLPGQFADQVSWVWRYTPTPYGPLSIQLSTWLIQLVGFEPYLSALMMRVPALLGVTLIVSFLPRIARKVDADVQTLAWFSTINPLIVIDFVGGAHNDALMMGLVILGVFLAYSKQFWLGAIVVGVAMSIKQPALLAAYPIGLIATPWVDLKRDFGRVVLRQLASFGVVIGVFSLISVATRLGFGWMNAVAVPGLVISMAPSTLIGWGLEAVFQWLGWTILAVWALPVCRYIFLGMAAGAISYWALTLARKRPMAFLSWSYLAFAFGSPALHSWYLMWGGLLYPLSKPSDRLFRNAVGVTTVLLVHATVSLAWRNDLVALGLAGVALALLTLVRSRTIRRQKRAAPTSTVSS